MRIEAYPDAQGAGRAAARMLARLVQIQPSARLGLATGHTMIPVYGELVRLHQEEGISFKKAVTFNLDEYVGMGKVHPDSFFQFMWTRFAGQVDLPADAFQIPDGLAPDLEAECASFERKLRERGGLDVQLLGLGRNGHIGFNEPGSSPDSRTRVVELSPVTRDVNRGDFRKLPGTPARAITMGIATILAAKKIIMVVTGWEKAAILDRMLVTPPNPGLPASFLHLHPDVTLAPDREAMEEYVARTGDASMSFALEPPRAAP